MPSKYAEEPEEKSLIGFVGTCPKVGIVGIRNAGKSTLFNALTTRQADVNISPYNTMVPNESAVPIPDERYDYLCQYHKPLRKVPAVMNIMDISILVKGVSKEKNSDDSFLYRIKTCDAILHLCRAFEDDDVTHVESEVNPIRYLEIVAEELRMKDEEFLLQILDKLDEAVCRGAGEEFKREYNALQKIKTVLLNEKKHIRFGDWSIAEIEVISKYLFMTSKPVVYLVNLSEMDYIKNDNKWLPKIKEWIDKNDPGAFIIPFSGMFEKKILDMEPDEKTRYLNENNTTSALDEIIVHSCKALRLEHFFTAGSNEVKTWIIQKGTKAPQAAGLIHPNFEKCFVMAEVVHFKDFKEEGSEATARAAGKYHQQGFNYTVKDGDIIFFKFNPGANVKDPKKK